MTRATRSLLLLFFLLTAGLACMKFLSKSSQIPPMPFAISIEETEIERTLKWHVSNALGSVKPKSAILLDFSKFLSPLKKQGILTSSNSISPPYRSSLWWPGAPQERAKYFFSPVTYSFVSIQSIDLQQEGIHSYLHVSFQWKIAGPSAFYRAVCPQDACLLDDKQSQISKAWQARIGETLSHKIIFQKTGYGYTLPLIKPRTNNER